MQRKVLLPCILLIKNPPWLRAHQGGCIGAQESVCHKFRRRHVACVALGKRTWSANALVGKRPSQSVVLISYFMWCCTNQSSMTCAKDCCVIGWGKGTHRKAETMNTLSFMEQRRTLIFPDEFSKIDIKMTMFENTLNSV